MQGLESLNDVKKIVTSYTPDPVYKSFSDFINEQSISFPEIEIGRNDPATIYYTSGSTGKPKGVLSAQKAVIATLVSWAGVSSIRKEVEKQKNQENTPVMEEAGASVQCVARHHDTGRHGGRVKARWGGGKRGTRKKWGAGTGGQEREQYTRFPQE